MQTITKPIMNIHVIRFGLSIIAAMYLSMAAYVCWEVIGG